MWNLRKVTIISVISMFILGIFLSSSLVGCKKEDKIMGPVNDGLISEIVTPAIDGQTPNRTEMATFALGCFWAPDSRFGSIDGVVRTRVGYAGGNSNNPTYHNLDGHSETIQIDYDPARITYEQLLEVVWDTHYPTSQPWSRQYMSIVFYHNDEQKELAISSKELMEASLERRIVTEIIPFSGFYLAEDYHQKYYLRQWPDLVKELSAIYPDISDFVSSTAVTRLNGYVGGYGTPETFEEDLSSLGLSETGRNLLMGIADRGLVPGCPLPSKIQSEVK